MIKIIINLALLLVLPIFLQAQYWGGNGRGDVSIENLNIPLANESNNHQPLPAFSLQQNYPNPFTSATTIKFTIDRSGSVKIFVYELIGLEVQTLVNEPLQPGTFEVSFDGSSLKSGIYFCKISAGEFSETKRMVLKK